MEIRHERIADFIKAFLQRTRQGQFKEEFFSYMALYAKQNRKNHHMYSIVPTIMICPTNLNTSIDME